MASSSVMFKMFYFPNAGVFNYLLLLGGAASTADRPQMGFDVGGHRDPVAAVGL